MDCLKGYIGIKNTTAAGSGLYLTQLPDISITSMDKIADNDQQDFKGVMEDIEMRSILKFRTLFTIEFNRCYKVSKREVVECVICENKALLAVALWYLMGAELMFERVNSTRINRFTTIDKAKAQVLRSEFEEIFASELHTAVLGIDIESSTCFEAEGDIHQGGFIQVVSTMP